MALVAPTSAISQVQRIAVLITTGVGLFPLTGLTVVAAIVIILDRIFGFHVQLKFFKRKITMDFHN